MRNVLARVPKGQGEMVAAAIRTIFAQPTGPLVRAQVETIAVMLEPQLPVVAMMLRDSMEEITAFADFPEAHWRKVWSTNPLERLNREVKRRTDVVGIFLRDYLSLESPGVTRNLSVGPRGLDPVGASPSGLSLYRWSRDLRAAC